MLITSLIAPKVAVAVPDDRKDGGDPEEQGAASMLRWLAVALTMIAVAPDPAAAQSIATKGASASGVRDARAALRWGGSGVRAGSPAAGANAPPRFGGHDGSGWYQRGFGGTLNPGWGYNFGPNLGGLGH
jgi:hypothetical protein